MSLTVMDLKDSRVLLSHEGDVPRNPASTTKLVTARVALETLGLAHRFTTTVYGQITAGHASRLVIRSDGDPTITTNGLRGLVAELKTLGLVAVDEGIWVDQSAFDENYVPPAFEQQPEEWAAFRAPVCATAIDHNRLTVSVMPSVAGESARISVEPPGFVSVVGTIETLSGSASTSDIRVSLVPAGDRLKLSVSGRIGEKASKFVLYRRVEDPRRLVGFALRELLREQGINVVERVEQTAEKTSGLARLATVKSDALPVILRALGKDSDNFTAEMLMKAIAAKVTGKGESTLGAKAALEYLSRLGPLEPGSKLINGSGLFDANRLSTNRLVAVLDDAYQKPGFFPEFASQLSLGNVDGTLKNRLKGLQSGCTVRAKTGTLRATSSLAGYIDRPTGSALAFALIVEGVTDVAALKPEVDAFVAALCDPTVLLR